MKNITDKIIIDKICKAAFTAGTATVNCNNYIILVACIKQIVDFLNNFVIHLNPL